MPGSAAAGSGSPPAGGWRPSAGMSALRLRARMMAAIRRFFDERGVLEVETPALSGAAATDRHLQSLPVRTGGGRRYLHTSPEFPMKRLLAAGSGPIWQSCHVFRDGEAGRRHNPEFSLLEWYRPGFGEADLIAEVAELLTRVGVSGGDYRVLGYREAFVRYASLDPFTAGENELAARIRDRGLGAGAMSRSDSLDLVFSQVVAASLPPGETVFINRFPAEQAALARLCDDDPDCAQRFECFLGPAELANGYVELTDADEQRRRFEADNRARESAGLPRMPVDERLLKALESGLPYCSGVALGLDRLLMLLAGAEDIAEVLAFPWEIA